MYVCVITPATTEIGQQRSRPFSPRASLRRPARERHCAALFCAGRRRDGRALPRGRQGLLCPVGASATLRRAGTRHLFVRTLFFANHLLKRVELALSSSSSSPPGTSQLRRARPGSPCLVHQVRHLIVQGVDLVHVERLPLNCALSSLAPPASPTPARRCLSDGAANEICSTLNCWLYSARAGPRTDGVASAPAARDVSPPPSRRACGTCARSRGAARARHPAA